MFVYSALLLLLIDISPCLTADNDRLAKLENKLSDLETENIGLEYKLSKLQEQATPSEFVGFSASLQEPKSDFVEGNVVIFNNVLVNAKFGGTFGYNEANGLFTCPQTGTYFSSVSVVTPPDQDFHGSVIYGTNSVRGRVKAEPGHDGSTRLVGTATSSETQLIRCGQGVNLRVEVGSSCATTNCGLIEASRWTVFFMHQG